MKNAWIGVATTNIVIIFAFAVLFSISLECFSNDNQINCDSAYTTPDLNYCAGEELRKSESRMKRYLDASFNRVAKDKETLEEISKAQKAWIEYKNVHCGAVYSYWREGTIRGVATISCEIRLTNVRTYELWEEFLTYMDSTPPILPEPDIHHDR